MTIQITNKGRSRYEDAILELGEIELGVHYLGDGQIDDSDDQRMIITNSQIP